MNGINYAKYYLKKNFSFKMALEALKCQSNLTLCDYFAIIGFDKKKGLKVLFFLK